VSIGHEASGYRVYSYTKYELVNKKLSTLGEDDQHPVIPPRIYAELIIQLNLLLDDVYDHINKLQNFLLAILKNEQLARSVSMQRKLGYMIKDFEPHFPEAAEIYGLDTFFYRYDVKNVPSFMAFLTRVQHGCRIMIHIYTGMRNSEVLSLKINSLKESEGNVGSTYRFVGDTSKFIGQKKSVSWVTSNEVLNAYKIAIMVAKITGDHINLRIEQIPLFISTSYLGFYNNYEFDEVNVRLAHAANKSQEIYDFLGSDKFKILAEDISHLEKVNPFRAWEAENIFSIGSTWRFTTHQFRRSLAFYVAQSSLVSLPSLKRQLKHIGREMTLYYCQTKQLEADFDNEDHISRLIQREKPLADATAYLYQVLLSDEPLFGSHGQFVEKNVKSAYADFLLKSKRDDLIRQFKKGEIAYKETPLGACTTIEPCDKKALREIAACVTCDRAVIKSTKLNKVIGRQELFVSELEALNPEGVEYRSEKAELDVLKQFRFKVIERNS
jgi:integrase